MKLRKEAWDPIRSQRMRRLLTKAKEAISLGLGLKASVIGAGTSYAAGV